MKMANLNTLLAWRSGDILFQVANIPKSNVLTKSDLLKCRPIAEMKYVTEKRIITLVLRS